MMHPDLIERYLKDCEPVCGLSIDMLKGRNKTSEVVWYRGAVLVVLNEVFKCTPQMLADFFDRNVVGMGQLLRQYRMRAEKDPERAALIDRFRHIADQLPKIKQETETVEIITRKCLKCGGSFRPKTRTIFVCKPCKSRALWKEGNDDPYQVIR